MDRFADKFRIESSRLRKWDYCSPWWYFVTICTLNHNKFFGSIIDNKINLSKRGLVIQKNISLLENKFVNLHLENYVVMPNHVHLLIKLKYQHIPFVCRDSIYAVSENRINILNKRDGINAVSTENNPKGLDSYQSQMTEHGLGRIIQWLKAKSTYEIRKELTTWFGWQSRYHEEIIRDEKRLKQIKYYIENNPRNWDKDKLFRS